MQRATLAGAFRVRFVSVLAAMYLVVVLAVTLWPTAVDRELSPAVARLLQELYERGVPTFVDYGFVEFAANILFSSRSASSAACLSRTVCGGPRSRSGPRSRPASRCFRGSSWQDACPA